ncbi:hypothetical protein LP419_27415 [Massilia sp. H-1]|nr:hypothetical protein LP419_27415 [Massilia sp. H-1]
MLLKQRSRCRCRAPLRDWGKTGDVLVLDGVDVSQAGQYQLQVRYFNGANQINLGISGGVKWLAVKDAAGAVVAQGVVQLPHARREKSATPAVYSTPLLGPAGARPLSAGVERLL